MKQPKKRRLWLNDGSCVRLRPEYRDPVWSYDFVHHRTDDGKVFRTVNILDEYSRECLAIRVSPKLNSTDVMDMNLDGFAARFDVQKISIAAGCTFNGDTPAPGQRLGAAEKEIKKYRDQTGRRRGRGCHDGVRPIDTDLAGLEIPIGDGAAGSESLPFGRDAQGQAEICKPPRRFGGAVPDKCKHFFIDSPEIL